MSAVRGSLEPAKHFLSEGENGGKPWWALTGSNRRHPPCKRSAFIAIWHVFANRSPNYASLFRFIKPESGSLVQIEPPEHIRKWSLACLPGKT